MNFNIYIVLFFYGSEKRAVENERGGEFCFYKYRSLENALKLIYETKSGSKMNRMPLMWFQCSMKACFRLKIK